MCSVLLSDVLVTAIRAQSSDLFQVLVIAAGVVALLAVFRDLTAVQYTQVASIAVGLLMRQVQAPRGSPAACRLHRSEITFFPDGLLLLCAIWHRRNDNDDRLERKAGQGVGAACSREAAKPRPLDVTVATQAYAKGVGGCFSARTPSSRRPEAPLAGRGAGGSGKDYGCRGRRVLPRVWGEQPQAAWEPGRGIEAIPVRQHSITVQRPSLPRVWGAQPQATWNQDVG